MSGFCFGLVLFLMCKDRIAAENSENPVFILSLGRKMEEGEIHKVYWVADYWRKIKNILGNACVLVNINIFINIKHIVNFKPRNGSV